MRKEILEKLELEKTSPSSVIISIDKDLNMIPGWHYNPDKDSLYFVEYLEGMKWFYKQLLMGDSVDNIPGIKGIGIKKAEKLIDPLETLKEMYDLIYDKYSNVYLCPDDAILQVGRLLWMRTRPDEIWQPFDEKGYPLMDLDWYSMEEILEQA